MMQIANIQNSLMMQIAITRSDLVRVIEPGICRMLVSETETFPRPMTKLSLEFHQVHLGYASRFMIFWLPYTNDFVNPAVAIPLRVCLLLLRRTIVPRAFLSSLFPSPACQLFAFSIKSVSVQPKVDDNCFGSFASNCCRALIRNHCQERIVMFLTLTKTIITTNIPLGYHLVRTSSHSNHPTRAHLEFLLVENVLLANSSVGETYQYLLQLYFEPNKTKYTFITEVKQLPNHLFRILAYAHTNISIIR
jgi:hypothetical protein